MLKLLRIINSKVCFIFHLPTLHKPHRNDFCWLWSACKNDFIISSYGIFVGVWCIQQHHHHRHCHRRWTEEQHDKKVCKHVRVNEYEREWTTVYANILRLFNGLHSGSAHYTDVSIFEVCSCDCWCCNEVFEPFIVTQAKTVQQNYSWNICGECVRAHRIYT